MDSSFNTVRNVLHSSAYQRPPIKSPAGVYANSVQEMSSHDIISMLEMYAQHGNADLAFDVFQMVKNSPYTKEVHDRQAAVGGSKRNSKRGKKQQFPSLRHTLNTDTC